MSSDRQAEALATPSATREAGIVKALVEANSLLRSAYSIATREGRETYWEGFTAKVKDALDRQLPIVNAINAVLSDEPDRFETTLTHAKVAETNPNGRIPSMSDEDKAGLVEPSLAHQRAEETLCTCGAAGSGEGHTDWCPWLSSEWHKLDSAINLPSPAIAEGLEDGWLEHDGNGCPVAPETIVDIKIRNGNICEGSQAGVWYWPHSDIQLGDIIAYRVVSPAIAEGLEEIEGLLAGITPGPWWSEGEYSASEFGCGIIAVNVDAGPPPGNPTRGMVAYATGILPEDEERCVANAAFIARAPEIVRTLLAEVKRLSPGAGK